MKGSEASQFSLHLLTTLSQLAADAAANDVGLNVLGCQADILGAEQPAAFSSAYFTLPQSLLSQTLLRDPSAAKGGDSSVVRALDSWLKGCGFESLQEWR